MVRARLERAIGTGEIVGIIYHGGSQPGAFRDITPIQIDGDQVRARCYTSGAVKTFVLDKIELRGPVPTPEDNANTWRADYVAVPKYQSIADVHQALTATLVALGWNVVLETTEEGESLSLRRMVKNGSRLKKWPDVALIYQAFGSAAVLDFDSGDIVLESTGPRTRPWIVRSPATTKTFGSVERAVEALLEQARAAAPQSPHIP